MKARQDENGAVTLYDRLPDTFNNGMISIIGEMDKLSNEELEALGFYDVIEPELNDWEFYGGARWDEQLLKFVRLTIPRPTPPPLPSTPLTKFQFISRLTMDERVAIYSAEDTSPVIKMWLEMFRICEEIELDNPDTRAGVLMLEALGFIAAGRAEAILNPAG